MDDLEKLRKHLVTVLKPFCQAPVFRMVIKRHPANVTSILMEEPVSGARLYVMLEQYRELCRLYDSLVEAGEREGR